MKKTEMDEKRLAMGKAIVEFEGRFDQNGNLLVYDLPAEDGGGDFEVAGINEKYHRPMAIKLKHLIERGKQDEALTEAATYIMEYTTKVIHFFPSSMALEANPQLEFVLRDCAFNRGLKGSAATLQLALGMYEVDGVVGPLTHREFARQLVELGQAELLKNITAARETYERSVYPWKRSSRDESSSLWKGLSNRWAKADLVAQSFV
jgi:hypothetical protein